LNDHLIESDNRVLLDPSYLKSFANQSIKSLIQTAEPALKSVGVQAVPLISE